MPDIYYRRNLPHVHPEGYPLFITFRLADSIPAEVLAELKAQRVRALNALKTKPSDEIHKIEIEYFSRYDAWLDRCASGPRWLADKTNSGIVAKKIRAMDREHYQLMAYCIMPNHVHLLIEAILANHIKASRQNSKIPCHGCIALAQRKHSPLLQLTFGAKRSLLESRKLRPLCPR